MAKDAKPVKATKKYVKKAKQPCRLYSRGVILGPKRSKSNVYPNCTLVKIEGVKTKEDTEFYLGKRIAYIYKAKTEKLNTKFRVIWGKVRRAHGNSGVVRTKFRKNIPAKAFGGPCRIMLYPSSI
uniref:60S ribosomal protein L35a n=1 Tax=Alexandrium andersonii TaxID=327968 RepID=A0A7S2FDB2_9DINO|mmetsp:Transcript_21852/g.49785  ORF Transcript_21852/g.49785 Transcript_21852/m.49785 type:complete len:125 (+) Transcript_21852:84-458(+)